MATNFINIFFKFAIIALASVALSACSGERCIEADDFGFANLTVSARYTKDEMGNQSGELQVAPWRDSNYRVNGRPLTILVRSWEYGKDYNKSWDLSAWCPWYGDSSDKQTLSSFCERLQDCQFIDGTMCTNTRDARIANAPCLFRKGIGLYALIAKKGFDPNISFSTIKDPRGISFHLGEKPSGYQMFDIDKSGQTRRAGGIVYNYNESGGNPAALKQQYANSKLYFKILDKYYDDNNGQYRISIKSGVTETASDPISYVTALVKTFLFGAGGDYGLIRGLYLGVVNNSGYKAAVSALLTLYIMFTALSYLSGTINFTQTELIVRVSKIALVSVLLSSEYSWSFFNNYLFVYFIGGVEQILQIIMDAGSTGPGSSGILSMIIAPQTFAKLFSLLFVDWLGWLYIALFFFALYFVVMVYFEATIIYLTALIAIGMIIVMGPIFVCFLLFGITRSLFENWLRQLISYAIQPIILFTGLVFISLILRQELYGALGFRVCKQDFPKLNSGGVEVLSDLTKETLGFSLGDSIFYWWFPMPMKGEQFIRTTTAIPIPIDHFTNQNDIISTGGSNVGDFCEAYGCIGQRYVDLPFLDPIKDKRRITQFWNGQFVQVDGLILIFVALYLLHKFNGLAISTARFITGTSGNLSSIEKAGNASSDGIKNAATSAYNGIKSRLEQTPIGRAATGLKQKIGQGINQIKQLPAKGIDKLRVSALKKAALSNKPDKAILTEVKRTTGLTQDTIVKDAKNNYQKALQGTLTDLAPKLRNSEQKKLAKQISKVPPNKLKDEFSKILFGPKHSNYNSLSKEQKAKVQNILRTKLAKFDGNSLEALAHEAKAAKHFQEAYVDAYQAMSNRGIGLLGKKVAALRTLQEIRSEVKKQDLNWKQNRNSAIEKAFSGVEGIKSNLYSTVTGGRKDIISRNFAGGAWHEVDTSDRPGNERRQTYNEQLWEKDKITASKDVANRIDLLNKIHGTSVISPQFLAEAERRGDKKLTQYRELEQQDLQNKVYSFLSSGSDPVIMGETFMQGYARESEMKSMIDRAYEKEQEFRQEDPFLSQQSIYESRLKQAEENILDVYKQLGKDDIKPAELVPLLEQYAKGIITGGISKEEALQNIEKLKESIKSFELNQALLTQIDRKNIVLHKEIERNVSNINKHLQNINAPEYKPKRDQLFIRNTRTIEDLLKKK